MRVVKKDGISYPNKIGRAFIKQLPVENIHFEYSPKWAENKRYDIYFEYNFQKYIIEMDGIQHFVDSRWGRYEDQAKKDAFKTDLAEQHGIQVIRIDCRQSRLKYIKNSLLNSELSKMFDLSIIDWSLCQKESSSDLLIEVCEYFSQHSDLCAKDLENIFGIDKTTIQNYLNSGTAMGICSFTDEVKERNRNKRKFSTRGNRLKAYSLDGTFIGEYQSAEQCALALSKIFDEEYKGSGITAAIRHSQSKYKNVIIKCEKENTLTDEEKEICKYFNDNSGCNANEIADRFNISYDKARIVLKRGTECGLCNYDSRKIFSKCAEIMNQHDKHGNKVIVSKNDSVISEFTSVRSCVNYMNENYNSGFSYYSLTDKLALKNGHAFYKGYEFQYKENVV